MNRHNPYDWAAIGIFLAIAIIGLILIASEAHSHSWYDAACCNDNDCRPAKAKVIERDGGYLVTEFGEFIPYQHRKIKRSLDGEFHVCTYRAAIPDGQGGVSHIRCLYVPPNGF